MKVVFKIELYLAKQATSVDFGWFIILPEDFKEQADEISKMIQVGNLSEIKLRLADIVYFLIGELKGIVWLLVGVIVVNPVVKEMAANGLRD